MKFASRALRVAGRIVIIVVILLIIVFLVVAGPALKRRLFDYPRLQKARAQLWTKYKAPQKFIELNDYKGVLHAHSYWSHDSRGVLQEILPAAKKAGLQFIFFSDHKRAVLDTFPRALHGVYDGVIFEPGTESGGMMVSPMDSVVLDWSVDRDRLIKNVVDNGGMVLYVHTEEPHDWSNPDYQGMEIYNIHTDLADEKSATPIIINAAVNGEKYKHWVYRQFYDDQTAIWARWDSLNMHRRIVGFGAVDAHNNQGVRARRLPDGRVEWVGPNAKTLAVVEPGWKEKLLLGEPDAAGWAFKWEVDSYFASFHFVNTHVFSDTLSAAAIRDNLVKGHAYVAFEHLAEARGFQFFAVNGAGETIAVMGDSVAADAVQNLRAVSPLPVRFELIKNGTPADVVDDVYEHQFEPRDAGVYRVVASLNLAGERLVWVLSNPIYIY